MKQFSPAVIQPITTSITEVTIIRDGFFFNIKQANNKLVRGRSLRKTLYLKQEKETISQKLIILVRNFAVPIRKGFLIIQ